MVLGDHGMNIISGNHGGDSPSESHVPLLVWTFDIHQKQKKVVNIEQVDLSPTISSLFNLKIPERNVGVLLNHYFSNNLSEVAKNVESNAQQLYSLAMKNEHILNMEYSNLQMCTNFKNSNLSITNFVSKCQIIMKSVQKMFISSVHSCSFPIAITGALFSLLVYSKICCLNNM
jgi:hypothetical protein